MSATAPRPRVAARARDVIRVASVPGSHVYVRHLADPDGDDRVVRLPDVPPADGRTVPGGWWPPAMLDPAWVRVNRDAFDVFHVHFGFDARTPDELRELTAALEEAGKPLVLTLHDLRNPHHADVTLHEAQLGALVEGAAAIVTLTPGAAEAIARRWGRRAEVLAHPHVVDAPLLGAPRPERDGLVIGLHAKSVRANMDPLGVARAIADTLGELPGAQLRIDLHDEVFDPANHWYDPQLGGQLRALAAAHPQVELVVHPYFGDDELWEYFRAIDVSVLPYRFGTHSGWLEACHDLGTTVVAPTCGFYAEQQPCIPYVHDDARGLDAQSLAQAVRIAYAQRPHWQASVGQRMRQRRELARAHERLYARLLD